MSKRTNKTSLPVIMNLTGDQAFRSTGTLTSATTALNLSNGQAGVLSWDFNGTVAHGSFIPAATTAADVSAIKIVTGTPASSNTALADLWEAGDQAFLSSGVIRANKIRSVATKRARFPMYGGFAASSFSVPSNNVEYKAYVRLLSVRNDRDFGNNDDVLSVVVPATDFTTLGTVSPRDYVLKHVVAGINSYSKLIRGNRDVVAFGVKIAGGTGTVIGTLVEGSSIPFQTINGSTYSIVADAGLLRGLAHLVNANAQLVGTSTILNVNTATAGSAADCDAIIVLGLPSRRAVAHDTIGQIQTSAELTLGGAFDTVDATYPTISKMWADEGDGQGFRWAIQSKDRYLLNVHTMQNHPHGEWFVQGKDYINDSDTKYYSSVSIDFYDTENALNTEINSPKNVALLLPCEKDSTFTFNVNNVVTRLAAGNTPVPMVTSNDAGTGTASVNTIVGINDILGDWLESARTTFGFDLIGEAVVGGPYLS